MPELAATAGRYVAIFRNMAPFKAEGAIMIRYPGDDWELDPEVEKRTEVKSDLVVENIRLNSEGNVVVHLANQGKGTVNPAKWHAQGPEAVTLVLYINGKNWDGATLPVIDPERSLRRSGGKVAYTSSLKLQEPARITASIDESGKVMEENERNNKKTVTLDPADAGKRYKRDNTDG